MEKRPLSVSIIAWFLIITAGISLVITPVSMNSPVARDMMEESPMPVPAQFALMFFGLLVSIVAGIGMLKGKNWARLLYVVWGGIGIIIGLLTSPVKTALIPSVLVFALIAVLLYRPGANSYFAKT
jgi:hypothetical protein